MFAPAESAPALMSLAGIGKFCATTPMKRAAPSTRSSRWPPHLPSKNVTPRDPLGLPRQRSVPMTDSRIRVLVEIAEHVARKRREAAKERRARLVVVRDEEDKAA